MLVDLLVWTGVVALAAVVSSAYLSRRSGVALGALFMGASFSGVTAPLGDLNVRVEQPALAALAALVLWRQPRAVIDLGRANPLLVAAGALYIGPQVVSSALFSTEPLESLKIAAWLALSMVGAVVAAVLVFSARSELQLPRWIVWAAAIQVAAGLIAVLSQGLFGTTWGVQVHDVVLGKTRGLSWEANIMAINMAMALAFLITPASGLRFQPVAHIAALVWLSMGLGLAYSRGGLIALACAAAVVSAALVWVGRHHLIAAARLRAVPVLAFSALSIATALVTIQVQAVLGDAGVGWTPETVVIEELEPARSPAPGGQPAPEPDGEAPETAEPNAGAPETPGDPDEIRYVGTGDTLAIRLNNMKIALREVASSPLVGLGTDSYRYRHDDAHVSNLTVATLYEGGVLGLIGLAMLLGAAVWTTWKVRLWAYLAAVLVLIIGYQVTDAFRFASNWILIGAIIGLWTASRLPRRIPQSSTDTG